MRMYIYYLLLAAVAIKVSHSQCAATTCKECISSGYSCAWCRQTVNFTAPRCQSAQSLANAGCLEANIQNPITTTSLLQNEQVRDSNEVEGNAVQIQPQKFRIRTRLRQENKLTMTFQAANNFPVDLYFLFDNSYSMDSQIKNLAKLTSDIGQAISNISTNYLMGYGVFQDKVILPFTDTNPEKLSNPCHPVKCAQPFEFKHLLSMTKNITQFQQRVHQTEVTGNIDHPEGSIDAILQAITCKSAVGWRPVGRKLLIFASNDRFHLAGDGRLAGIVIPNDGQCHLDEAGKYAKELEQDYPSVSQLADIVESNEVHIIFAVSNDQFNLFKMLSSRVSQSVAERLASPEDTSNRNIKDIIEKKYKEMVSEVEIVHSHVQGVDVQIKSTSDICKGRGTNKCQGLRIGVPITFDVEVKVTECLSTPDQRFQEITIYPDSMKNDKLVIEIETLCDCDCETNENTWEVNSNICTAGNGTLKCGVCDCDKGRTGKFCECSSTDIGSSTSGCIKQSDNSTVECSGLGKCECGVCICNAGYSGPNCECYDRGCRDIFNNDCGGGSRGHCVCGQCVCEQGYTGSKCECKTSNESCIYDNKVCNNFGTCKCGECTCVKEYIGDHCESCFLCGDTVCDDVINRRCAQCAFNGTTSQDASCLQGCPAIQLVSTIEKRDESVVCSIKQPNGCLLAFQIKKTEASYTILVQKTAICAEPVNIVPIAAGVVGGVVAIGLLLLLLWKILTTVFDRIEYSKFEEDLKQCKWAQQDNPFYKGATTTYKNPMLDTSETPKDK